MLSSLLRRAGLLPKLLFFLLLGARFPAQATHLLGGEMTYRYLDNRGPTAAPLRYEITVTVYNNCGSTGITAPRSTASVGIYDQATGARVVLTALNFPTTSTFVGQTGMMSIPQTSLSECIAPAIPPGCTISGVSQPYRLQKFTGVVNLPNSSAGYYALFTDGSRNVDVTNLSDPGAQAMTLYVALSPPQIPNRSPVFSDIAVAIICANDTTVLLNNAVDADGDRLVYTFGQPYAITGGLAVLPTFFSPPPTPANYSGGMGYGPSTPFGTTAGNFAILNPATGLAKYGAATVGRKYAVAVDVQEYRTIGGREVLIGTTRRDLQLVVASCPNTKTPVLPPVATLPRDYTIEAGSTLTVPITATQDDGHPLALTLNSVLLDGAGGYTATLDGNPGTVLPGNPTGTATISGPTGTVAGTFVFSPSCTDARTAAYDVAFTVKDNGCAGKTVADVLHITVVKPKGPTAISGDQLVCGLNATRSYTATGGTAATISWRVVGGTIVGSPTANPVQVQWGGVGTGTVVARGLTQYGCPTDSVTSNITISQTATLTITGSLSICGGSSTTLTVAGGRAPYTVSGGASPITGSGPFVLSPTATTTYTITGAATPTTCGATGQVTVTVSPAPAANAGPATLSTCSGTTLALGAAPVSGSTYRWSPATGLSSSTVANPTLTLSNTTGAPITTTYTLTETIVATGCQATNTVAVTVNPLPVAAAGTAATICSGSSTPLGASPVAGYTYSWSPATGLSDASAANPTATLINSTSANITQAYTLTVTSAAGCVSMATVTVTVRPPLVAQAGAAATICSGSSATLGAAPVAGYTYSWSPATGLSSSTVANPTVTLNNTGTTATTQTYTLTTTSTATGCVGTATVAVTANPLPVAVPGPAVALCSGSSATLGATPVAGYTYSWSPATGLSSSTVANPTVMVTNTTTANITQTYTLTVTNAATGCVGTATVVVTTNPAVAGGTIGASQTVCPGSTPAPLTSLAGASGGPGTYTYQWEQSADNVIWTAIAGATSDTYAPGAATALTYYRRQGTAGTCGTAASNVVAVRLLTPLVTGVALATPPTQCAGTALTFTPVPTNGGSAPTYRWFVNGTQVASGPTFTSSTLATGDQVRVELTPTVGLCASGLATATVTVTRTFVAQPTVSISLQTVLPVCSGAPVSFSVDKITNGGTNPQYQWQIDGVAVAGSTTPVFTTSALRNGQLVTLALRATTVCDPVTVVSNAIRAGINPPVDVEAGPSKEIMQGEQVTLEGRADGTYPVTWTPALGLTFGSNPLRPVAAPLVTTTYTLSGGVGYCADSSPVTVTVTPRVRIPTAISPNGDGVDDSWQIDNIEAYAGNHVLVFNRWGNKVFDANSYGRNTEWNGTISGQPAPIGTYYYVITLGNGRSYSGPLTVVY